MSLLFADIFEAIRYLRICKGTTEKEIMNYVQERVGGCMSVGNVLKTIRTLNKLVEEGVLIKKGRRYIFPTKPPELADNTEEKDDCNQEEQDNNQEDDTCDEEEDNEDNEEDEGEEDEEGDGDGDEDGDEDEEEDDDDEEEEEDDDNEEEDEECEDDVQMPEPENKPPACPEKSASKGLSQQKALNSGEPQPTENVGANVERTDTSKASDNIVTKKNSLKNGRKNGKGQNCGETKNNNNNNNNGKNKGGETIAFCARDFIDSQYSQNSTQAKPVTLHEKPQDDLTETEKYENESVARAFGMRKRESKSRKGRAGNDCRSRSPIKGNVKNGFFTSMNLDHSDDLRKNLISSEIFQEVTDTPMDIDHDNEVVDLEYDILRHRSPIGPSPIAPGVHLDRTESCCSQPNTKSPEDIKAELDFDCKNQFFLKKNADFKQSRHSMAKAIDMQNKRLAAKEAAEKDKEKNKRELCSGEGNGIKAEKCMSLCSVCEKKKRNS